MASPKELRDRLQHAVLHGASGQRYQVREPLGEGGQGWVFKATQDDAGAPFVVVKVLRPDVARSEAFTRFEREIQVLRALSSGPTPHPSIVRFLDHGRATVRVGERSVEVSFLVHEYVDGQPLSKVCAAHGGFGLPVARVRRVMRQVARALTDMHAQGVVHRDLKPSNILLSSREANEVAKVADFGLAKMVDGSVQHTAGLAGASVGYAPPEQYETGNRRVSPRTDVFAFAAILFEMLSGCEAFPVAPGDTALRVVARMMTDERPALARVSATVPRELRDRPDVTAALDREIARATSGEPEQRHASIQELWNAVEPLLRSVTTGSTGGGAKAEATSPSSPDLGKATPAPPAPRSNPGVSVPYFSFGAPARVLGKPMKGERLRSATFTKDGRRAVALGAYGLYNFAGGTWSALRAPRGVDIARLRGIARLSNGDLLLYGDGCAVALAPSGDSSAIDPSAGAVTWLGALADEHGLILTGESRTKAQGTLAIIDAGNEPLVRDVPGTVALTAAARLDAGVLLVCGTHGALFVIDGSEIHDIAWGRTGHLYAASRALDGGAFVVGSGGHALSIAPPHPSLRGVAPPATLEAVQTTRDLTAVTIDASGTAAAAGAQGRLLVRRAGTWARIPLETEERLIGVWAPEGAPRPGEVIALTEDGAVLEVALS